MNNKELEEDMIIETMSVDIVTINCGMRTEIELWVLGLNDILDTDKDPKLARNSQSVETSDLVLVPFLVFKFNGPGIKNWLYTFDIVFFVLQAYSIICTETKTWLISWIPNKNNYKYKSLSYNSVKWNGKLL